MVSKQHIISISLIVGGWVSFRLANYLSPISIEQWVFIGLGVLGFTSPFIIDHILRMHEKRQFLKRYRSMGKMFGPMSISDQIIQHQEEIYAPHHNKNDRDILKFYRKYEQQILFSVGERLDVLEVFQMSGGEWAKTETYRMEGLGMRAYMVRRKGLDWRREDLSDFELIAISSGYPTTKPLLRAARVPEAEQEQRQFRALIQIFDGVVENVDGELEPTRWKMSYWA